MQGDFLQTALTTLGSGLLTIVAMVKQGRRPHYIREHALARGLEQKDIVREIGADKGQVSRWYGGATPLEEWQKKLAKLFKTTPDGLFKHPDEAWLSNFISGRDPNEIKKIKATLEAAFPPDEE